MEYSKLLYLMVVWQSVDAKPTNPTKEAVQKLLIRTDGMKAK